MAIGIKIAVMVILALILISLASGMFFLTKDDGKTDRTVKALTYRVILSLLLFFILVIGYLTGNISPHGV